jgi:hypothetical protein
VLANPACAPIPAELRGPDDVIPGIRGVDHVMDIMHACLSDPGRSL